MCLFEGRIGSAGSFFAPVLQLKSTSPKAYQTADKVPLASGAFCLRTKLAFYLYFRKCKKSLRTNM